VSPIAVLPDLPGISRGADKQNREQHRSACCPGCQQPSSCVHSYYTRYFFAAAPVRDPNDPAKLIRSEQTFNGVKYLAGWIFPSTVGDEHSAGYALSHPSAGKPDHVGPIQGCDWCDIDLAGGAIINEQTGALTRPPQLSDQDLTSRQMDVPHLGVFHLTICNLAVCS
jgi:hypothetical protein